MGGSRRRPVAAVAAAAILAVAAGASAQDRIDDQLESLGGDTRPNTDLTPQAKADEVIWELVAGARYGESAAIADSPTTFDTDLYKVSFRNPRNGVAVGSRCADSGVTPEETMSCDRVPAAYVYRELPGLGLAWMPATVDGDDTLGYVGAVAWLDGDTAVAVGGTGRYPHREHPRTDDAGNVLTYDEWVARDPAGEGRAWIYDPPRFGDHDFHELNLDAQRAAGMRGMTAIDFFPVEARELGFAGGLGQIWRWEDGSFDLKWDKDSSSSKVAPPDVIPMYNAKHFLYRVREIRFAQNERAAAFAVTAGCCGVDSLHDVPRILGYDESHLTPRRKAWGVRPFTDLLGESDDSETREDRRLNQRPDLPESLMSLSVLKTDENNGDFLASFLAGAGGPESDPERASVVTARQCLTASGGNSKGNLDLTPFTNDTPYDPAFTATRTRLTTARLVAADGDTAKSAPLGRRDNASDLFINDPGTSAGPDTVSGPSLGCSALATYAGDGILDWSVGELRSQRGPLGRRALAYATHLRPRFLGEAVGVEVHGTNAQDLRIRPAPADLLDSGYEPGSAEDTQGYLAARFFLLPSYQLSGVDIVGDSGEGWAVGAHGAILRLRESASTAAGDASEPAPPRLGNGQSARLPDDAPYDEYRAVTAPTEPGTVAPLASRPVTRSESPRLAMAGAPDPGRTRDQRLEDVAEIVMSRDGSEGWALGPSPEADNPSLPTPFTSLYHYDGIDWSRCDPTGVPGLVEPDFECAGIAGLRSVSLAESGGATNTRPVRLTTAARVPVELDKDAANNDDFEVVAAGTPHRFERNGAAFKNYPLIMRYRKHHWNIEPVEATRAVGETPRAIAFTAPDDGWILGPGNVLYHYDGERWAACGNAPGPAAEECRDPDGRIAFQTGTEVTDLTTAAGRVYLFGSRIVGGSGTGTGTRHPMILSIDRSGGWTADASVGGLDPGFNADGSDPLAALDASADVGRVGSLVLEPAPDGGLEGWAFGHFGGRSIDGATGSRDIPETAILRLTPGGTWTPFRDTGALADSGVQAELLGSLVPGVTAYSRKVNLNPFMVRQADGRNSTFLAPSQSPHMFRFSPRRERFELVPSGRPPNVSGDPQGGVEATAPDAGGGFWAAVVNAPPTPGSQLTFFHFTDRIRKPVFEDTPHPFHPAPRRLTALAGASEGTVWAGTNSDLLGRYDRITGWTTIPIRGWDPGRLVTRPSHVAAVAVNNEGTGLAVGEGGRIADLSPTGVRLDEAAGTSCARDPEPPCGTGHDLSAAAVAPDGSGMAGGDRLTLLWRPAGGAFRAVAKPSAAAATKVTGVAMPRPDRAWIATDRGAVYAGTLAGNDWSWELESLTGGGDLVTLDHLRRALPLRAITVDADGHGFAVGDRGVIIERVPGADAAWRRVDTPYLDDLTAVALPASGGPGALVGGDNGVVLTLVDGRFHIARQADWFNALSVGGDTKAGTQLTGPVVGLALMPGSEPGEVEAWAGVTARAQGPNMLLHHASDPSDPLMRPGGRVRPLPDAPAPRPGELTFAAFGKSECDRPPDSFCPPVAGTSATNEVVSQAIVDELSRPEKRPDFTVFTGDVADSAAPTGASVVEAEATRNAAAAARVLQLQGTTRLRRWSEFVADPLIDRGIPLFGAIGSQDLSETFACDLDRCYSTKNTAKSGENLAWRQAMAAKPWPRGDNGELLGENRDLEFRAVGDLPLSRRHADRQDAADAGRLPTGGASTHYAVDVLRAGEPVARIVTVDSSLRSLAAGDALQQPLEARGGQTAWLEAMLCPRGSRTSSGERCSREPDQQAIVVSNTPTYSYGPVSPTETATDAATFESTLMRYNASVVVSGRLGWNGRYWATAPGLHEPCPGEAYRDVPPEPGTHLCGRSTDALAGDPSGGALSDALRGLEPPAPPENPTSADPLSQIGLLPFVVASGAGGKFGGAGEGRDGFWHGYTIVRLDASGDPRAVVIEQRPVFDWIGIDASAHVLRPGQKLTLRGVGQQPRGAATSTSNQYVTRYQHIDSPAITHRYDLVQADKQRPYLPKEDAEGQYMPLDPLVGTVDSQTGVVTVGRGRQERTFAVAILSVGDKAASWPLVFEPAKSFKPRAAAISTVPAARQRLSPPQRLPPVRILPYVPAQTPPQPPPPPPPPGLVIGGLSLPSPPSIPGIPGAPTPSATAPPSPPAPPPPPAAAEGLPLSIEAPLSAVSIVPTVIPPTPPPINPAPPSGSAARKEAKQRQAATAKSEEGAKEQARENTGDLADQPPGPQQSMTRADFTAISSREQPSAWARGALYGGGLTLMALALAASWSAAGPTPRRRRPELPAPAWNRRRSG